MLSGQLTFHAFCAGMRLPWSHPLGLLVDCMGLHEDKGSVRLPTGLRGCGKQSMAEHPPGKPF